MKLNSFLIITALLLQTAVLAQNNPLVKYLPDDVSMIIHFDLQKMGHKIPEASFRQSFMYREMMKDPGESFISFFTNPGKYGIDMTAGLMMAMNYSGDGNKPSVHILGKLSDASLFAVTIKDLLQKGNATISRYGTDHIISSDNGMFAGWNNDIFVLTTGDADEINKEFLEIYTNEDTSATDPVKLAAIKERIRKSKRDFCFQLLTKKTQNVFTDNITLTSALNSDADIKIWSNGRGNPISGKLFPLAPVLSKFQAFGGKNRISLLNFENGRIVMKSRNYPDSMVAAIYKKYPAPRQNFDLLRRLPAGTLLGFMNMTFNQAMADEILQSTGLVEMLDSIKKEMPFDLKLTKGVFTNNMMLAVIMNDSISEDSITNAMGGIQVIAAMPIADKTKFEKLKEAVLTAWQSMKESPSGKLGKMAPVATYNDEMMVISLSPETAKAFLNNPGTGELPSWLPAAVNHPMLMHINLKAIMAKAFDNNKPQGKTSMQLSKLVHTFGDIVMYGGEYENESINSTMEFRFSNQTENGLKQLFDMFNGMVEQKETAVNQEDGSIEKAEQLTIEEVKKAGGLIEPPPPPPPVKKTGTAVKKSTKSVIKK